MTKKEAAVSFLKMVADRNVRAAYDKFIAPTFKHHNQYFKGGRESLMDAMEQAAQKNPNKKLEVKRIYEDGDTVITHSLIKQNPEDIGGAVIHIFKFQNDQVVELWDLGQQLIEDSPNENGPF
jgi:predicted SnoaL-like aldol condensation-catalyzing enzyme